MANVVPLDRLQPTAAWPLVKGEFSPPRTPYNRGYYAPLAAQKSEPAPDQVAATQIWLQEGANYQGSTSKVVGKFSGL